MKFYIVSTGWNCGKFVQKCFASLQRQTYQNFEAIMISDGSTDSTEFKLQLLGEKDQRINTMHCSGNVGAAYHRFQAITDIKDKDAVIVLLGMDDELLPGALERIKAEYDAGKWMTYGNWKNQEGMGLPETFMLDFPDEVHAQRSYRKEIYRSTAPNTFKRFLFDEFTESEFKYNGEWIKATTESPLMFGLLEMCGKDRIGIIRDYIYLYNQRIDSAKKRLGREYQEAIYKHVINSTKKELYESIKRQVV